MFRSYISRLPLVDLADNNLDPSKERGGPNYEGGGGACNGRPQVRCRCVGKEIAGGGRRFIRGGCYGWMSFAAGMGGMST